MDKILEDILNFDYSFAVKAFLESITIEMFIKFIAVYFIIIWISVIAWVIKDINNRTNNIFLQVISILIILFWTPFSVFIYLLIRPSKTLFEKYYDEIESNLDVMSSIIEGKNKNMGDDGVHCFNCHKPISSDFKFCPNCKISLRMNCGWYKKIIYIWRLICPYCWDENNNKEDEKKEKWEEIEEIEEIEEKVEEKVEDLIIINTSKNQENIIEKEK